VPVRGGATLIHTARNVSWSRKSSKTKWNATLASVSPQHSFHAAEADAIALSQSALRGARTSIFEQVLDGLLAQPVDESPPLALRRQRRTLLLVLLYLDPVR
jgi:hypothetical protein